MQEEQAKKDEVSLNELKSCKKELDTLRRDLNRLNEEKESWFSKKEQLNRAIRDRLNELKEMKKRRDELNAQIKEEKKTRDEFHKEVNTSISAIKQLEEEKDEVAKRHKVVDDPARIKRQIDRLEMIIQTEGISFEKEKELMKQIKDMAKKMKAAKQVSGVWEKIHGVSRDIDEKKKMADTIHQAVQSKAKESQEIHEKVMALLKEVKSLEKEEEQAFNNFVSAKGKFNEVNTRLKDILDKFHVLHGKVDAFLEERESDKRRRQHDILKIKEEDVEQKIKKGGKLTTEDLLVFQSLNKYSEEKEKRTRKFH